MTYRILVGAVQEQCAVLAAPPDIHNCWLARRPEQILLVHSRYGPVSADFKTAAKDFQDPFGVKKQFPADCASRGRMDASPQLSIDFLPAWAKLQDVQLTKVGMQHIDRKGYGLVSGDGLRASDDVKDVMEIIRIPAGLVLSAATVEEYAKVDHNFKELLDAAGRKVTLVKAHN